MVFRISSFNTDFEKDSGFVNSCSREMFLLSQYLVQPPFPMRRRKRLPKGCISMMVSTASLAYVLPNNQLSNRCRRAELDGNVPGHVLIQKGEAQPLPATPTAELQLLRGALKGCPASQWVSSCCNTTSGLLKWGREKEETILLRKEVWNSQRSVW